MGAFDINVRLTAQSRKMVFQSPMHYQTTLTCGAMVILALRPVFSFATGVQRGKLVAVSTFRRESLNSLLRLGDGLCHDIYVFKFRLSVTTAADSAPRHSVYLIGRGGE